MTRISWIKSGLLALAITAGSAQAQQFDHCASFYLGTGADVVTTAQGISSGVASEANPANLGGALLITAASIAYVSTVDDPVEKNQACRVLAGIRWAVVGNNLAVLAGIGLAPVVGVVAGVAYFTLSPSAEYHRDAAAEEKLAQFNMYRN